MFGVGRGCAGAGLGENGRCLAVSTRRGMAAIQTVVGESASVGMEEIMTLPERIKEIIKGRHFLLARFLQAVYPCVPRVRSADPQSLVRAECGIHPKLSGGSIQRPVTGQVITGIVG